MVDGADLGLVGVEHSLLDLVSAAVVVVDLEGRVLGANRFVEQLYGWTPEELVGRPSNELALTVIDDAVIAEISAAVATGQSWEGSFEVRHKDGRTVPVRVIDSPVYNRAGELTAILSIGIDASHERDVEQQLDEQTRVADEYRFLAECTTALASAVDYAGGLRRLARASADFLGDICLIDAVENGEVRRMAAVHRHPEWQPAVDRLLSFLPDPKGAHPAVRAMRTGASAVAETMPEDFLRATTRDDDHYALVKDLGFESFLCVPLTARGRILGALTLISCDPERRYGPNDLSLAQQLAWRAALGLDNMRTSGERARIVRVLQASLLPPSLPQINGAALAARYVSAEEDLDIGGDFYDVFDAGYGSWAVTIGDVCGRGPQAATVTGLVRHTLRSLALKERDPGRLLASLNAVLNRDLGDPSSFCTVWYGMLRARPDGLHLRFASGGHPPLLVLRGDGTIVEFESRGLVLGPFEDGVWRPATAVLKPGDTAILYTDGVTESRRGDEQFDDFEFRDTLGRLVGASAEVIAATIAQAASAFTGGASPDDMAVLVIQAT